MGNMVTYISLMSDSVEFSLFPLDQPLELLEFVLQPSSAVPPLLQSHAMIIVNKKYQNIKPDIGHQLHQNHWL